MLEMLEQLKENGDRRKKDIERGKKVMGTRFFFNIITSYLDPDNKELDEDLKLALIGRLGQQWLTQEACKMSPNIDELQVEEGWVINHPNHDANDTHQRCTLEDMGDWATEEESMSE